MIYMKRNDKKNMKLLCAAIAFGLVFTVGGQRAEAEWDDYLYGAASGTVEGIEGPVSKEKDNSVKTGANYNVKSGVWKQWAFGGFDDYSCDAVSGNHVTISGGELGNVVGGYTNGYGEVSGNTVTVTGGTAVNVYGGYSGESSSVHGNTVTITGGTIDHVYGGYSKFGSASGNIINLGSKNGGKAYIKGNAFINAYDYGPSSSPGGTLNVYGSGHKIGLSLYAEKSNINFFINGEDMDAAGSKTMLRVDDNANEHYRYTAYISDAAIAINGVSRNVGSISKDDRITLLNVTEIDGTPILQPGTITDGLMSVALELETGTAEDGRKTIIAKAKENAAAKPGEGGADPQPGGTGMGGAASESRMSSNAKSPVETMVTNVSLLNIGGDMLVGESMNNAAAAVAAEKANGSASAIVPFVAAGGSNLRVYSGSYVDMKSWNVNMGFAKEIANKRGTLLIVPVIEYGRANYDSYVGENTHGKGTSRFTGIGLAAKQSSKDGFYYEASLRGGRNKSDYLSSFTGVYDVRYDISTAYYGLHLGAGKVVQLNDKNALDCYGKMFYTRQNGKRARLSNGYDYDFEAVDSFRTRLGVRYNHKLNETSSFFAGLAWQHEFDSEARATIINGGSSFEAPSPSVKGDTGILELGWKAKAGKNLSVDVNASGYTGKQKGVAGSVGLEWKF